MALGVYISFRTSTQGCTSHSVQHEIITPHDCDLLLLRNRCQVSNCDGSTTSIMFDHRQPKDGNGRLCIIRQAAFHQPMTSIHGPLAYRKKRICMCLLNLAGVSHQNPRNAVVTQETQEAATKLHRRMHSPQVASVARSGAFHGTNQTKRSKAHPFICRRPAASR